MSGCPGSSVASEHEPSKLGVAGWNPARGSNPMFALWFVDSGEDTWEDGAFSLNPESICLEILSLQVMGRSVLSKSDAYRTQPF